LLINSSPFNGLVIASKAGFFIVKIDLNRSIKNIKSDSQGIINVLCRSQKKMRFSGNFVYVGDEVVVDNIDFKRKRGTIIQINNRVNYIDKPPLANVTDIFVLTSLLQPEFSYLQTSRFLVKAENSNLKVHLILTKSDLIDKLKCNLIIDKLKLWGYDPIVISLKNNIGMNELKEKLYKCQMSVLCGPSGVGKSSLINYLIPNSNVPIKNVSNKLKRGVNTTRHVEIFNVFKDSYIADTPGFNKPFLNVKPRDLVYLFPELSSQLKSSSCKYRDCLHRGEQGCCLDTNTQRYDFYREDLTDMVNLHLLESRVN